MPRYPDFTLIHDGQASWLCTGRDGCRAQIQRDGINAHIFRHSPHVAEQHALLRHPGQRPQPAPVAAKGQKRRPTIGDFLKESRDHLEDGEWIDH